MCKSWTIPVAVNFEKKQESHATVILMGRYPVLK